ncbi:MAG: efflux transporter periplasmic adaptor subunit [Deltaproteobacteria bacterium]|nr:efflux transporter periplasmic adaptor subunit [Deltaproteobacteria bacterium]
MRSQKILPFLLLAAAMAVVFLLSSIARQPQERIQRSMAPLIRVETTEYTPYRFFVIAHGAVSPRTESDLVAQVSGEIVSVSPSFAAGGFFEEGDILARIDPADYRVDRETARAVLARADSEFGRAQKELGRQQRLADQSVASESRIDDAENAFRVAEATRLEAQARLERAERDLTRTVIKAPYRGLVRSEQVDVGQFVTRGTTIATLYAVDFAEVRLPLPDRELAYLDLPPVARSQTGEESDAPLGARVELSAEFAGRAHIWEGALVRTEAELDPRSRMVRLVARVTDPYGIETTRSAPLAVGLFVEAKIEGQEVENAVVLPRDALRDGDRVYVVDADDRIRFRSVEVLRTERDTVILASGLTPGERVCTSPLQAAIDGMKVRVVTPGEPQDLAGSGDESVATSENVQ